MLYHQPVVHQIAFARRLAYFFCLSKTSIKKKTPDDAGPADSLVLLASGGRQKLADAQRGLASCSTTGCAVQRHRMGNSRRAHTSPGTRYPDDPVLPDRISPVIKRTVRIATGSIAVNPFSAQFSEKTITL